MELWAETEVKRSKFKNGTACSCRYGIELYTNILSGDEIKAEDARNVFATWVGRNEQGTNMNEQYSGSPND